MRISVWLWAAGVALLAQVCRAAPDDAAELTRHLSQFQALSGGFVQTQYSAQGERLQESTGTFLMQRPGLLRWETEEPFPQLLISNGEKVWLYDPDLEQVTISPVKKGGLNAPAVILSNDPNTIRQKFHVRRDKQEFVLTPIEANSSFKELRLEFTGDVLGGMRVLDSIGQKTDFTMSTVRAVAEQPKSKFEFQPPAGVDVLIDE